MPSDLYYSSAKHKHWRNAVLRRDKYLCRECARYGRRTVATVAHHILPRDEYPEKQFVLSNGLALCAACHNREHLRQRGAMTPPQNVGY